MQAQALASMGAGSGGSIFPGAASLTERLAFVLAQAHWLRLTMPAAVPTHKQLAQAQRHRHSRRPEAGPTQTLIAWSLALSALDSPIFKQKSEESGQSTTNGHRPTWARATLQRYSFVKQEETRPPFIKLAVALKAVALCLILLVMITQDFLNCNQDFQGE